MTGDAGWVGALSRERDGFWRPEGFEKIPYPAPLETMGVEGWALWAARSGLWGSRRSLAVPAGWTAFDFLPPEGPVSSEARLACGPTVQLGQESGRLWAFPRQGVGAALMSRSPRGGPVEPVELSIARLLSPLAADEAVTLWVEETCWTAVGWAGGEPVLIRSKERRRDEDWEQQVSLTRGWLQRRGLTAKNLFLAGPARRDLPLSGVFVDWRDCYDGFFESLPEEAGPLFGLLLGIGV